MYGVGEILDYSQSNGRMLEPSIPMRLGTNEQRGTRDTRMRCGSNGQRGTGECPNAIGAVMDKGGEEVVNINKKALFDDWEFFRCS